jgi:hypothetical protein
MLTQWNDKETILTCDISRLVIEGFVVISALYSIISTGFYCFLQFQGNTFLIKFVKILGDWSNSLIITPNYQTIRPCEVTHFKWIEN